MMFSMISTQTHGNAGECVPRKRQKFDSVAEVFLNDM